MKLKTVGLYRYGNSERMRRFDIDVLLFKMKTQKLIH